MGSIRGPFWQYFKPGRAPFFKIILYYIILYSILLYALSFHVASFSFLNKYASGKISQTKTV